MITWTEPFMQDHDAVIQCSMTKEECISVQRSMGEEMGYEYEDDREALIDFMVVRHAVDTEGTINLVTESEIYQ